MLRRGFQCTVMGPRSLMPWVGGREHRNQMPPDWEGNHQLSTIRESQVIENHRVAQHWNRESALPQTFRSDCDPRGATTQPSIPGFYFEAPAIRFPRMIQIREETSRATITRLKAETRSNEGIIGPKLIRQEIGGERPGEPARFNWCETRRLA